MLEKVKKNAGMIAVVALAAMFIEAKTHVLGRVLAKVPAPIGSKSSFEELT